MLALRHFYSTIKKVSGDCVEQVQRVLAAFLPITQEGTLLCSIETGGEH